MPEKQLTLASPAGRWLLLATILGSALAGIDATVVNVALPALGADLDAGFTSLQWTVSAYALTLASFILLGGTLGDRFGRRRVFVVGVVWFALASLACGLAADVGTLITARALQGVGAALLTPGSLALLQVTLRPEDRARAIGTWSGLGGVATAVGPLLGGWLVDVASWRWVFLINLPLAALVVWVAVRHVPESHDASSDGVPPDWAGGLLGALTLGGLTYALVEGAGAGSALALPAVAVGLVAAVAFVVRERRARYPVLPLDVFASAQFSAVNAVTFLVYGGFGVLFFLLVVQLQVVAGFGPVAAGVSLLPVTLVMLTLSSRSGALAGRLGPRRQMAVGPVVCAGGIALLTRVGADAGYLRDVLPGVVVFGLGLAIMVAPLTVAALDAAPVEHAGMASGVNNAVARTGGLLAVAAIPPLAGLGSDGYTSSGYRHALWISVGVLLLGAAVAAVTVRGGPVSTTSAPTDDGQPHPSSAPSSHCAVGAPPLSPAPDRATGPAPPRSSPGHPAGR